MMRLNRLLCTKSKNSTILFNNQLLFNNFKLNQNRWIVATQITQETSKEKSSAPNTSDTPNTSPAKLGLKDLMKKYGLAAFIVYNGISLIDLSITFSLLHFGGEEQVFYLQSQLQNLLNLIGIDKQFELSENNKPSFWSTFAVAYSIHKLLVPIRVPLTAALTPTFAKKMQSLGLLKNRN